MCPPAEPGKAKRLGPRLGRSEGCMVLVGSSEARVRMSLPQSDPRSDQPAQHPS